MVNHPAKSGLVFRTLAAIALASVVIGCGRQAAELAALKADNERLRTELANLRRKGSGAKEAEVLAGKPDMNLDFDELWRQRFEDNEFRAKQRLADKTLRLTGFLDGISRENLLIYGSGKSRNVRLSVNLEKAYANSIQDGLAALEKGVALTVQGRFGFEKMELNEARIVDKATGAELTAGQLQALGAGGVSLPVPTGENQ